MGQNSVGPPMWKRKAVQRRDIRRSGQQLRSPVAAERGGGHLRPIDAVEKSHRAVSAAEGNHRVDVGVEPRVDEVGATGVVGSGEKGRARRMRVEHVCAHDDPESPVLIVLHGPLDALGLAGARGGDHRDTIAGTQRAESRYA